MNKFTAVDGVTGQVLYSGTTHDIQALQTDGIVVMPGVEYFGGWIDSSGLHHVQPERPTAFHVWDWTTKVWTDPRTLAERKSQQTEAINLAFAKAATALTADYPPAERLTWPTQQAEALAWAADPSAPTPFLDGIAAARGIAPADMRARTLGSVQAFMAASQYLVGTRQALRDAIAAASSIAEVESIVWPVP